MNDTIKTILYSWAERKLPRVIPREITLERYIDMIPKKIIAVTGFRRVGKTYLLFQILNKLLKDNSREEVIYINFDDERIPEETSFLTELFPMMKQIFSDKTKIIFLDEIQNMPNWGKWLRRIYDTEDIMIFITGSSSKVSSREIPTELRGRCLEVKLFPLSFKEYLRFKKIKINMEYIEYSENERGILFRGLDEYLFYGGLPEVVLTSIDKKFEILQQYYGTVVRRDLVERYQIRNEEGLKAMIRLLLNSKEYSINKLYNILKSLNYEIGKTTLLNYIGYLESTYFIHSLPIFSPKVKDQLQYPRKIYFIDNGFINSLSTKFSKDMGRLCENLVAIDLLRRYSKKNIELYYWRDHQGREVDFVVKEGLDIKELIQVSYNIEDYDTRRREIKSLIKASDELKCKNLKIITWDYEDELVVEGRTIKCIPLWKWLI